MASEEAAVLKSESKRATRRGVLIVNTKSRQGEEWFAQAKQHLTAMGVELSDAIALQDPKRLPDLIRTQIAEGEKLIVLGGGDGSFSGAVDFFVGTDVALGVLPLGTVNDFARNLEIPADIEAACRIIADGHTAPVDLGVAGENYFTITASVGFSACTQDSLKPELKKMLGPFGYLAAALLALGRLKPLKITVRSERGTETLEVLQAGVINGHTWMGGAVEIPGVDLQSGGLAFYAVPTQRGLFGYLRMARFLSRGDFFYTPGLRAFNFRDMTLTTETPSPLVVDGDLIGQTPVRLRIAPGVLRVCVPQRFLTTLRISEIVICEDGRRRTGRKMGRAARSSKNRGSPLKGRSAFRCKTKSTSLEPVIKRKFACQRERELAGEKGIQREV